MFILFPCEYGNISAVDENYKLEYLAAIKHGFDILLVDYDEFLMSGKLKLNNKLDSPCVEDVIYRGWMLKYDDYVRFYKNLLDFNLKLINSPDEYRNCHEFYYSYNSVRDYTPESLFFKDGEQINWNDVFYRFDRFLIKDFVKSVKGFDFPKYFDNSYVAQDMDKYIQKFIDIRGSLYTGGIVVKKFVDLKHDDKTHEFRAFYVNGELLVIYHNSCNYGDELPIEMAKNMPKLGSNFYTIDFAVCNDGNIIVIETGDGQVSGIDDEKSIDVFYERLKNIFL